LKLVFIYGPPAVGKLTVARELSRLTGYKLFHNHVAIDFAKSVFEFGTPAFWRLVGTSRSLMFEEAAKSKVNTIFTFVYGGKSDDPTVEGIVKLVRSHRGRVCFVRLHCSREDLMERIVARQRKKMGKLATKSGLVELFSKHELDEAVPFARSLSIDTGSVAPAQAARRIASHFKLGRAVRG
jgi:chloramphenicol 3-O-phosphotransferase